MTPSSSTSSIDWAVAQQSCPGMAHSGDLALVLHWEKGVLLALIDGIGHGEEAFHAAETAAEVLREHPGESAHALIQRCHDAMTRTRGGVLTVASFNQVHNTLEWCGVGNVEAMLFRADANQHTAERALLRGGTADGLVGTTEKALLRGGTLGGKMPADLYPTSTPVHLDDLLIMSTDGILPGYEQDVPLGSGPQRIADHILENYFKGNDDACVLATRFTGGNHE